MCITASRTGFAAAETMSRPALLHQGGSGKSSWNKKREKWQLFVRMGIEFNCGLWSSKWLTSQR